MGEWIGMIGGLGMVMLVCLFALLLLQDIRVLKTDRPALLRSCGQIGCWLSFGLLLNAIGALCRALISQGMSMLHPWEVWTGSSCSVQYLLLTDGASLHELFDQGCLPGTVLLFRGFGKLLIDTTDQACLYLGLLCGAATMWEASLLLDDRTAAACIPGCILLFLPASIAPMMLCGTGAMLLNHKGHPRAALIPAVAAALLHPFGWAVLLVSILRLITALPVWLPDVLYPLLLLLIGGMMHWFGWVPETIMALSIPLLVTLYRYHVPKPMV